MVYKHIVLPGGGPHGLTDMGILFYCIRNKIIDLNNIESFYGTSAGGILCLLLCMQNDCDTYEDYIINCMMDKIFYVDPDNLVNIFQCKGLINENCFRDYLKPFFDSNNINIDITLKEYYDITKKNLYLYATRVQDISVVEFSHLNFPNMKLLDALHASCAIPGAFSPVVYNNEMYIDGGVMSNYPLEECLSKDNVIPEEVIGVKHVVPNSNTIIDINNYNIFDMTFYLICCTAEKFSSISEKEKNTPEIKEKLSRVKEIHNYISEYMFTANDLLDMIKSKELRRNNFNKGYEFAKVHFENSSSKVNDDKCEEVRVCENT